MYYVAKFLEAAGMTVILIEFLRHFPALMSIKVFGAGIAVFGIGWVTERYLLKR